MWARILIAMSVLVAASAARADDPPPEKKPAEKPTSQPLERFELDKRAARVAYDSAKLGSELWAASNFEGCFRLYQGSLLALQPMLDHRPKLAALVKEQLEQAKSEKADKGAFTLRQALDAIQKETTADTIVVPKKAALWERLGGEKGIKAFVHDFLEEAIKDPKVNFTRDGKFKLDAKAIALVEEHLLELISELGGGPFGYGGRDIKKTHAAMKIKGTEYDAMIGHLAASLKKHKVAEDAAEELLKFMTAAKSAFVSP